MGGNSLNLGPLKDLVKTAGDGTIVPSFYRPREDSKQQNAFVAAYQRTYGKMPDQHAAQGYDSMNLLAYGIQNAKSTHPKALSSSLHHIPYWSGLTGVHSFDVRGDVVGKKYFFQVLKNGEWEWLPVVHFPYLLWQFDRLTGELGKSPAAPKNGFVRGFVTTHDSADLRELQLNFLHEIFRFKSLGVIYAEDGGSDELKKLARMQSLAQRAGFKLSACGIRHEDNTPEDMERQLLRCLSTLALHVNVLNISSVHELEPDNLRRLLAPLQEFKVPIISLQGDPDLGNLATVRLSKFSDLYNTRSDKFINLFSDIVRNQKIHEFAEKVESLPILELNLDALEEYGMVRNTPTVQLCPDFLIDTKRTRLKLPNLSGGSSR